jgi:hypothetical protein
MTLSENEEWKLFLETENLNEPELDMNGHLQSCYYLCGKEIQDDFHRKTSVFQNIFYRFQVIQIYK